MTAADLTELLDREHIRDCLARAARGEDRRNAELLRAAFWPGAAINQGIFNGSFEDYLAWVVPGSPEIPITQHVLGQTFIDLHVDCARIETHVLAYHRVAADHDHRDVVIGARYLDWMEKIDGHWRIADRSMVFDWCQDLGEAVDWTTGLMGMPFDTGSHAGRGHGDPSERMLGDGLALEFDDVSE